MNVVIIDSMSPFCWGAAEEFARALTQEVRNAGHAAELIRVPFKLEPHARIPSQMLLARTMELYGTDCVIGLSFPGYLVRHAETTIWATRTPPTGEMSGVADAIHAAHAEAIGEAPRVFAGAPDLRLRLQATCGVDVPLLPPPVVAPERFAGGPSGDYVYVGGRINVAHRQHLLIEALRGTPPDLRMVIAGAPDDPSDALRLREAVAKHGLEDRVHLHLRRVSATEHAAFVNASRFVASIPEEGHCFASLTSEAATAGKPVLTTTDSDVGMGIVSDESGWISAPDSESLSHTLTIASREPEIDAMGAVARARWLSFGTIWPDTVRALLP